MATCINYRFAESPTVAVLAHERLKSGEALPAEVAEIAEQALLAVIKLHALLAPALKAKAELDQLNAEVDAVRPVFERQFDDLFTRR